MKQKIVINVQMRCSKCRTEAMKIVASAYGVMSVVIQGSEKDVIVVVGNGVDAVGLCTALRKKVGRTILVSVEPVKILKDNPKHDHDQQTKEEGKSKEKKTDDHDHDHDHKANKKRKIVIKVQMKCGKCGKEAMKILASANG